MELLIKERKYASRALAQALLEHRGHNDEIRQFLKRTWMPGPE
jgi:hypothetical protein